MFMNIRVLRLHSTDWKSSSKSKEWHFPFWNIFFRFTFLYYANEKSDEVTGDSTEKVQHSIKNISRSIKVVLSKLGTRNVHHKSCYDNSYAAGPVLIKIKIPRFSLKRLSA